MDFKKNLHYFEASSLKSGIIVLVIGFILLLASPLLGILVLALGAALLYFQIKKRIKDEYIDELYSQMYKDIKEAGIKKLGLDEDEVKVIDPVVFGGIYTNSIGKRFLTKVGKDNKIRTSNYQVSVFFFGEDQVYYYSRIKSIIDNEIKEYTEEYFYTDIVSAATTSDMVKFTDAVTNKELTENYEYFKLTTTGGNSIQAAMRDDGRLDKAINGMKQLLRDKKKQRV